MTVDPVAFRPEDITAFWRKAGPAKWFAKDDAFDAMIRDRFLGLYEEIAGGARKEWLDDPSSCLAYILVVDQFPRNMFRASARAFLADPLGIEAARLAAARPYAGSVDEILRPFLFMPLMHSERIGDQELSVLLQHAHGSPDNLKFARIHRDIIRRFGRFPHRNPVLGRFTTPAEKTFLEAGGFSG